MDVIAPRIHVVTRQLLTSLEHPNKRKQSFCSGQQVFICQSLTRRNVKAIELTVGVVQLFVKGLGLKHDERIELEQCIAESEIDLCSIREGFHRQLTTRPKLRQFIDPQEAGILLGYRIGRQRTSFAEIQRIESSQNLAPIRFVFAGQSAIQIFCRIGAKEPARDCSPEHHNRGYRRRYHTHGRQQAHGNTTNRGAQRFAGRRTGCIHRPVFHDGLGSLIISLLYGRRCAVRSD